MFYDIETIQTTSDRNGYPRELKYATIGFETFEEAEEYAKENDMTVCSFYKKDGWSLWARDGYPLHAFQLHASDFSDDWRHYEFGAADRFWEETLQEVDELKEYDDWTDEQVEEYLEAAKKVRDKIAALNPGEFACVYDNYVFAVYDQETMQYHHDGTTYAIGCI